MMLASWQFECVLSQLSGFPDFGVGIGLQQWLMEKQRQQKSPH
jgi:hypothetical protein